MGPSKSADQNRLLSLSTSPYFHKGVGNVSLSPKQTSKDILWARMEDELEEACQVTGVMGYHLVDLTSGRESGFRDDVVFPTASTIKIAVLLGLATRVHSGELDWEQRLSTKSLPKVGGSGILSLLRHPLEMSLWDMACLMIALSDNDATNACMDLAGMDYINSIIEGLGLTETRLQRKMMDADAVRRGHENISTPRELSELVRRIYRRDGVSDPVASDVLTMLELPKSSPFSEALPPEVKRANKPGGLECVAVDTGIIYLPDRPVILAVMGSFLEGNESSLAAKLIRTAYRYLNLLSRCTQYGRA